MSQQIEHVKGFRGGVVSHGYGSGRPLLSDEERALRARARLYGNRWLPTAVVYCIGVLRDTKADPFLRMRAAENLFDRFGLPRRKETDVEGSVSTESMAIAMHALIEDFAKKILSEREKHAVRAEDVPFVESSSGNGSGVE